MHDCPALLFNVANFDLDLNAYARHIHQLNLKWWTNADGTPKDLDKGERFMLMVSELAEGLEGDRKDLQDDKLPQYKMIWVELADFAIRVLDSGAVYGWNFMTGVIHPTEETLCHNPKTVGAKLLNIASILHGLAAHELVPEEMRGALFDKSNYASTCVHMSRDLALELGASDFWQIVLEKLQYNWSRSDHAHANRQGLPGQKRY